MQILVHVMTNAPAIITFYIQQNTLLRYQNNLPRCQHKKLPRTLGLSVPLFFYDLLLKIKKFRTYICPIKYCYMLLCITCQYFFLLFKGQLISKCLFGVFNFFQTTNENMWHSSKKWIHSFVFWKNSWPDNLLSKLTDLYITAINEEWRVEKI